MRACEAHKQIKTPKAHKKMRAHKALKILSAKLFGKLSCSATYQATRVHSLSGNNNNQRQAIRERIIRNF